MPRLLCGSFADVPGGLSAGVALRDASWQSGASCDEGAVFVGLEIDAILHDGSLPETICQQERVAFL